MRSAPGVSTGKIRAALKEHGPMTALQIATLIGMPHSQVAKLIYQARWRATGETPIRLAGTISEGLTRKSRLYELSNKPDAEIGYTPPSVIKKLKYPGLDQDEIQHLRQLKIAASKIVPFRDPLIWALFDGVSTNTLGEQGSGELRA